MFQFNPVNKQVFVESVNNARALSKVHDCVDGCVVYVDANDNIIGATIPNMDGGMDLYLADNGLAG